MTNQTNQSADACERELIIDYLYQVMSDDTRLAFERRLRSEPQLRSQLQQQQSLDALVKPGVKPQVSERRLQGVSWSLHRQLQKQGKNGIALLQPLINLWRSQVAFKVQFASVLVAFMVGVISADSNWIDANPSFDKNGREIPLALVKSGDYQITDLQLKELDADNGNVHLVYSLASQTHLNGNLSDTKLQELLTATVVSDVSDSTRLDLVELLQGYTQSKRVQKALSFSLLNDPNPGVRMVAAKSLANHASDDRIKAVLRKVLMDEVNSGIRIAAFNAMLPYLNAPDSKTMLEQLSVNESNPYIRATSKSLLKQHHETQSNQI